MSGDEPEKKYVLIKDPNKSVIRLYDVPTNTFDDDDEDGAGAMDDGDLEDGDDE